MNLEFEDSIKITLLLILRNKLRNHNTGKKILNEKKLKVLRTLLAPYKHVKFASELIQVQDTNPVQDVDPVQDTVSLGKRKWEKESIEEIEDIEEDISVAG
jgi:hypothetical protein